MGNCRIVRVGIVLSLLTLCLTGNAWGRGESNDKQTTITVGGVIRNYLLHVPASLPKGQPAPLVLVFHGGGGHARNMPNATHFDSLADEQGFIVAYPDSFNRSWNDTRGLSPADDVGFIRALIDELQRTAGIDPKRVYATGISAGGFFSQRLACDLTDKIAAVASVAATMPDSLVPVCKPSRPISVMFMNGTKDPLVHIEGGPVLRDRGVAIALAAASKFWRDFDQTTSPAVMQDLPDHANDGTTIHREQFDGGKQGTQVVVYTIVGGGHAWPGGSQYLPAFLIGKASHNLDATAEIWKFFQKHNLQ
jgi:polyhydroxybutyrate depolymerase